MSHFPPAMRLLVQLVCALLALFGAPGTSIACTPPEPVLEAGFHHDDVSHLPRNARGVMFLAPSTKLKVSDFRLTSPDDKRALALRLRSVRDSREIRLEPTGGFAPNARYTFQYLPRHEKWRYPDRISVTIDDVVVDTAGSYAIDLAPQPEVRMVVVPGSPACFEPAVVLTQPFSYRIPAALAAYRTALVYGTEVRSKSARDAYVALPDIPLASYYASFFWPNRESIDPHYTGADDVILASCDRQPLRGTLMGSVAFPEVDDKEYRAAPVPIDLSRNVLGKCRPLDALTRTMQVYGAGKGLEAVCARTLGYALDLPEPEPPTTRWERAFSGLNDLAPTCRLVALAHAVRTREYVPDQEAMGRLGAALAQGLRWAQALWLSNRKPIAQEPALLQSIDGLDYLMRELPAHLAPNGSAMLMPLLPRLAAHLAEPKPYRPDALAALIVRAGSLPPEVRARIKSIAQGRTVGAPHARAILLALPYPGPTQAPGRRAQN